MKICIIGSSGHWQYTLNELPYHEVVGVCAGYDGENMSGLLRTLQSRGIRTVMYDSFDEIIQKQPDAAVVNTRFDLNAVYTLACLEKNIYVFSEKPLAVTYEELDKIRNTASDAFVSAMFGITYEPWCLCMKEAVRSIGEIRMMNGRKSYKLGRRADFYKDRSTFGGIIPWVGIHAIHWMYAVSGLSFSEVTAYADNSVNFDHGDLETTSACLFRMQNGAIATVTADYFRPSAADTHDDDRLRIVGTKAVVEYQNGAVTVIDENGTRELPLPEEDDVFRLFLERIRTGEGGVSMEESLYITQVALRARESADTGKTLMI